MLERRHAAAHAPDRRADARDLRLDLAEQRADLVQHAGVGLTRHQAAIRPQGAERRDRRGLVSAGDRAAVERRRPEQRMAAAAQHRLQSILDQGEEARGGDDRVHSRLRRAAVRGPAEEADLQPLEALVAERHTVARGLADDRAVGVEMTLDQGFGAQALHLLVVDAVGLDQLFFVRLKEPNGFIVEDWKE